jgi:hypothetical protein
VLDSSFNHVEVETTSPIKAADTAQAEHGRLAYAVVGRLTHSRLTILQG